MLKNIRAVSVMTVITLASGSMLLQSCSSNGGGLSGADLLTKENVGALAGAAGGAWVGSNVGKGKGNTVAIATGTLLGAMLGSNIGRSLDQADMAYYDRTSQYAMENARTGATTTWNNPDSGASGTITPTNTYQTAGGQYCREYTQTINVDGRSVQGQGQACRNPDGTWTIVN